MAMSLDRIEKEALSLPRQERAFLADRLLGSLDGDALTDVEEAWVAEAERRYAEYKTGRRPGIDVGTIFREASRFIGPEGPEDNVCLSSK